MLKKISDIADKMAGKSVLFKLILYWTSLVGEENKKILFPLSFENGILTVAVPNPIVKTYVIRVEHILYAKLSSFLKGNIKKIVFTVNPSCFTDVSFDSEKDKGNIIIDENEVCKIKEGLEQNGIDSEMAEVFAEIEVLIDKKRDNFSKKRDS